MARSAKFLKSAQAAHDHSLTMGAVCRGSEKRAGGTLHKDAKGNPALEHPTTTSVPKQSTAAVVSSPNTRGAGDIPNRQAAPSGKTPGMQYGETQAALEELVSEADRASAQQIHDHAVSLGADCGAEKNASALDLVKAVHASGGIRPRR